MDGGEGLWVEKYSEQHQRSYWVSRRTGKSTWTNPRATSASSPAAGGARGPRSAQLPSGWVEKSHNGRPYFVNRHTGERSWERPQTMPAPQDTAESAEPPASAARGAEIAPLVEAEPSPAELLRKAREELKDAEARLLRWDSRLPAGAMGRRRRPGRRSTSPSSRW